MKTLNRLLLLVLSLALLAAVYGMHSNTTRTAISHDTFYTIKWPWLYDIKQVSLFGVLGWCLLFVRREPTWTRIGLIAVILAFVIMDLPPSIAKELPAPPIWH